MKIKDLGRLWALSTNARQEKEIRLTDLMFLLFLGLKLAGSIDWYWIFVFCPLLFPVIIAFFMIRKESKIRQKMAEEQIKHNKKESDKEDSFNWEKIARAEAEDASNYVKGK